MPASSMGLRVCVPADCDNGLDTKAVAAKYFVSEAWVRRLEQRGRQTGEVAPCRGRPGRKRDSPAGRADGKLVRDGRSGRLRKAGK